jgi:hypothetical protein
MRLLGVWSGRRMLKRVMMRRMMRMMMQRIRGYMGRKEKMKRMRMGRKKPREEGL